MTLPVQSSWPVTLVHAFEDAHPGIRLDPSGASPDRPYEVDGWDDSATLAGNLTDLSPALRELNFRSGAVFPGVWASWTDQGRVLGVPVSVNPWGVRWRQDAFHAARLQPPSAGWTFEEFQADCIALARLAGTGEVQGLAAALGPMSPALIPNRVGGITITARGAIGGPSGVIFPTAMRYEGLWQAFVRGFGGTIGRDGAFSFASDAASVSAMATLTGLIRDYALPVAQVQAVAGRSASWSWGRQVTPLFAMTFDRLDGWRNLNYASPPWGWARMPRFPVLPVITVGSNAVVLRSLSGHPRLPSNAPQALATAEFGIWLNSATATNLTSALGPWAPPASADPAVQTRFWSGPAVTNHAAAASGVAAAGDWKHFVDVYDGFPAIPAHDAVLDAMASALGGTTPLEAALAQAQQTMNAQLPA